MRTARGLAALIILIGLLVGIPAALVAFGGNPLPDAWSWDAIGQALLRPASDRALIGIVTIIGWIAWAGFAASVVAEILNTMSGRSGRPGRRRIHLQLPGLGLGQKFAAFLIVAVVTMIAAPHVQPTASAEPRHPTPAVTVSAAPTPRPSTTGSDQAVAAVPDRPRPHPTASESETTRHRAPATKPHQETPGTRVHVVERGDWLWTLAERYLGDGARWHEIAKANPGIDPNRLAVGQKLTIPVPAHRPGERSADGSAAEKRVSPHDGDTITVERGDSLSTIAEDLYGTQKRWPEIYQQNRATIADPDLIDVGQKLELPDRKHLAETDHSIHHSHQSQPETRRPHAQPEHPRAERSQDRDEDTGDRRQAPPVVDPAPAQAVPSTEPATARPAEPAGTASATQPATTSTSDAPAATGGAVGHESRNPAPAAVTVGLLLAAGLITTLNRRRRRQLRARRPGRRIPSPSADATQLEEAVKAQHQPLRVEQLDQVTRAIAAHCHATGAALPPLSAVRVADHRIDFLFSESAGNPPAGFDVAADGSVWTLHSADLTTVLAVAELDDATPPYPALVTLGRDADTAHILIDLEAAAALTVAADTGEAAATTMLASIALELAVSPWAGDLNLTFAGPLLPGLAEGLDHPAVTHVDDIELVLAGLEARAAAQRAHLDDLTVGQKRADPELADAWCPQVVLFGGELTGAQAGRLSRIVTDLPRVAIAAVTTHPGLSPWRYELDESGTGHLSPHDWQLTPQLVTADQYRQILELICTSGTDDTTPAPWWDHDVDEPRDQGREATITHLPPVEADDAGKDDPEIESAGPSGHATEDGAPLMRPPLTLHALIGPDESAETPARLRARTEPRSDPDDRLDPTQLAPQTPDHPMLRIFGEPELVGVKGAPARRYQRRAMEFMLFLLEHPGATSTRLRTTFCITRDYTKAVISSLRKTLGTDAHGNPYLPELGRQPGYRLHDQVTSDWIYTNQLIGRGRGHGVNVAPTEGLIKILSMVRGQPLEGAEDWIEVQTLRTDIASTISDVAHELADRALEEDDLSLARWATGQGLIACPESEILLTDQLRTEKAAGNNADVSRLANRISANARALGDDLLDETREVLRATAM